MYDDKIIKQLYKKRTKFEGENEYVVIEPSDGSYDDTFIGLKNSKERVKQNVARQILDDSKKKIALSVQLYKDTTANPGYGTAEYWADRPFTKGVNGYKELVKKVYDRKKIKNNKEFYIVMGPSSAGKSTGLVDKLQKETGSFLADSDEIKKLIPEFNNGYNANGVHKESSDINSRILAMAMKAGDNVIYPTTGREAGKLKGIIDNAEKKGYKVYVDLVTADRSVLLLRNLARMLKTNRVVDGDKLLTEEVINGILETYKNLDEKYKRGKPIDTTPKR
jgi:predicted ABC-type ATPase